MTKNSNGLETPRTYFRNFSLDDLDLLYQLHSDPQVMRYFYTGPRSRLTVQQNLQDYINHQAQHGFSNWAVFEKNTGAFIGRAGPLVWEDQPLKSVTYTAPARRSFLLQSSSYEEQVSVGWVELSYVLHQKFWGLGFATEIASQIITWVFKNLTATKIVAVTTPEHQTSQRVLLKVGMQFEQLITINDFPAVQYAIYRAPVP